MIHVPVPIGKEGGSGRAPFFGWRVRLRDKGFDLIAPITATLFPSTN